MGKRGRKLDIDEEAIGQLDWYAVRATQVRHRVPEAVTRHGEVIAAHWVFVAERRLHERGFVTFLPAKGVHRFANGYAVIRKQKDIRPVAIYPGWLFVGVERGANRWRELQETPGVHGVLGSEGRPWAIHPAEMARLYAEHGDAIKAEERERFMLSRKEYKPGDSVRVVDGAFAGSVVNVVEVRGRDARVLLELFGAPREVEIDAMMLEAA